MRVADFDEDIAVLIDVLERDARVIPGAIGAVGFCLGGHLAFRAAFSAAVKATVCFYPTGLHDGELCADADAGSLAEAERICGRILLIFGTADPHTDASGRDRVAAHLAATIVRHDISRYDAAHAFMRDVGSRWDPERTDRAFAEALAMLRVELRLQREPPQRGRWKDSYSRFCRESGSE